MGFTMIDFPASPTVAQLFTAPNGVTYQWDGTAWQTSSVGGLGAVEAGGGTFTPSTGADVVIVFPSVVSGNSGNWLNTSTGRYTPPAGRYFIQCTNGVQAPTGGNGTWTLAPRKNGVRIPNSGAVGSGAASFSIPITVGVYVDANGTDYFDFVANCSAAGMAAQGGQFTAFPLSGLQGPPGPIGAASGDFYAKNSGTIVPAATAAPVIANSVITGNSGNWYNPGTGRFTPPAGRYYIHGSAGAAGASSGASQIIVYLYKNGVSITASQQVPGGVNWSGDPAVDAILDANGTDYFEIWMSANNGTTIIPANCFCFLAYSTQIGAAGPPGPAGPVGTPPVGDFCAYIVGTSIGTSLTPFTGGSILSGNAGSTYNSVNGRWTPPAGRYFIYGHFTGSSSAATHLFLSVYKNGVAIPAGSQSGSIASNTYYGGASIGVTIDANGTDYFNLQMISSAANTSSTDIIFGAFPLTGIAGQAGAFGTGFRTISNQTLVAAQPTIDVQLLPTDINQLQINFDLLPTVNDVDLLLQFYDGSGALVTTSYLWSTALNWSTATGGGATQQTSSSSTGFTNAIYLDYSGAGGRVSNAAANGGINGTIFMRNIRDTVRTRQANFNASYLAGNSAYYSGINGEGVRNASGMITGFRLSFNGGSNIAIGSNVTVWGSP
jgi:hypothetical protein